MPRPKKNDPDVLKRQVNQLNKSKDWRKEYDGLWERMVDLYRGKHYKGKATSDRMLVNLSFATKNVIAPSVAINNPKFTVNARKPDGANQAVVTEQVLNYLWRVGRYQEEFRLAVDDFITIGHGWIKVGYKATKPKKLVKVEEGEETEEDTGVQDRDETVPGNVESEVHTFGADSDRPFAERVSPHDIFVDPTARHPREMNWIAQRTRRLVADVQVDERYDASVRKKIGVTSDRRVDDESTDISGRPENAGDSAYVDVWEFYDIRKGTVATFAHGCEDGFLIPPAPMPYAFGHPFVMLRNYEVMDTFYPLGELEMIEELQQELNKTRTDMMNHRKRYQRKVLYDAEAFDQKGIDALRDDKDNVLVPVNTQSASVSIDKVVAPMPQMGTPPDFYNQSDLIASDIDRVSGVSDYMRGAQSEIRRTATEAAMIQDAQNARAADKLARVEQVLGQIGQRLVQLMQQYMTGEMVVRIVGMNAAPVWVQFDADYIQGDFDFEVEAGSTKPRNDSFRRQSAMQLVDAMAPFVGQGIINPMILARHVLQFGFDVKNPDEWFGNPMGGGMPGQAPEAPTDPSGMGIPPEMQTGQAEAMEGESPESPIQGVPPELVAQLMGQQGLPVG